MIDKGTHPIFSNHMKKLFFISILIIFWSCGKKNVYWQPHAEFPKITKSGTVLANETFSLKKIGANTKVLVLNFFAPKCKPCIVELPELEKINTKLSTMKDVEFITIGSTLSSPVPGDKTKLSEIAKAVAEFKKNYKVTYDSYLATSKELNEFGITGFPETFILHRDSENHWYVKRRYVSAIIENDVYQYIQR